MNDDLRRKAQEAFSEELNRLAGEDKPKAETLVALPAIDLGGNFCDMAPKIIQSAFGTLDTFGWLIPDKVENPIRAFLMAVKRVVLPAFCGSGVSPETTQKKS